MEDDRRKRKYNLYLEFEKCNKSQIIEAID